MVSDHEILVNFAQNFSIMNFSSKLGLLRITGFLEGCSYLLLGLTMIMKYQYQITGPNKIVGYAHGFLFIAYVLLVLIVGREKRWSLVTLFWALLASLLPFGTFVADAKIFRKAVNQ